MNADFVLGIIGLCGGLICAFADILLDFKGSDNMKYGPGKIMDSNWNNMSMWRFKASIWVAAVAVPMYLMGLVSLYHQIALVNQTIANIFGICAVIGCSGTMFIHATCCYLPIITKTMIREKVDEEKIGRVAGSLYGSMSIPFFILWVILVLVLSGIVMFAILAGILDIPKGFALLNPAVFVIIGIIFRLINKKIFSDIPGIFMPSLGIGVLGLTAAVSSTM